MEVINGEGQEGTGTYCCANTSMPVEGLDGRAGPVLCVGNAQGSTIRGPARAGMNPPWVAVRWRRVRVGLPLWVRICPIPLAGVPRPGTGDYQPMGPNRGGATCPYRHRETGT